MRALFIEFDGVLHPASAACRFIPRSPLKKDVISLWLLRWSWVLDDMLAVHPDVRIVVHSNWRHFVTDEEIGTVLGPLSHRFIGATPRMPKWDSIRMVAESNHLKHYRILDAWHDAYPADTPNLITCEPEAGLQDLRARASLSAWLSLSQ